MEIKECPQCGAPVKKTVRCCEYCKAEFFINSISSLSNYGNSEIQKYLKHYKTMVNENPNDYEGYMGLGTCYLRLDMYPLALKAFDKVIDVSPDVAPAYYYYCLSLLAGQSVKSLSINTIELIVSYLNTAITLDSTNMVYSLLLMIINHDYYMANYLREPKPTYEELLKVVDVENIDCSEIDRLKQSIKVPDFAVYGI